MSERIFLWKQVSLWEKKSLFEQIAHWKNIGEWESIRQWYPQADTHERYYNIVLFVQQNKAKYGRVYRESILSDPQFIRLFGYLDLDYFKKATFTMNKTS